MNLETCVHQYISCVRCKEIPEGPPLYNCQKGHITCEFCYLEMSICDNNLFCDSCGSAITSRNTFSELLLKTFYDISSIPSLKDLTAEDPPIKNNEEDVKSIHSSASSFLNISKRPVFCPNTNCSKMVAVTQLVTHFQFEHSKIPQEYMDFDEKKTLVISLNSMELGKSYCIALLLIAPEKEGSPNSSYQTLNDNIIAFPLMAAKLSFKPNFKKPSEENQVPEIAETKNTEDLSEIILIWVCGNVEPVIQCFIEISDEQKTKINTYYGSVNSLRENNDAYSVFLKADCLLLQTTNERKMTQNGEYPMDLKVAIALPSEQI